MSKSGYKSLPRFPRKEVRSVAHQLVDMGCTYEGDTNSNYPLFQCGSETVKLPMTPKGDGWKRAALRTARRGLGIPEVASTKNTKFRVYSTGFVMPRASSEPEWISGAWDEYYEKRAELFDLQADGAASYRDSDYLFGLARSLRLLERSLRQAHQPPPEGGWLFDDEEVSA